MNNIDDISDLNSILKIKLTNKYPKKESIFVALKFEKVYIMKTGINNIRLVAPIGFNKYKSVINPNMKVIKNRYFLTFSKEYRIINRIYIILKNIIEAYITPNMPLLNNANTISNIIYMANRTLFIL